MRVPDFCGEGANCRREMPDFVALRCAGCATFQVQQAKPSGRWQCRVCNEKQSVTRIYARDQKAANVRAVVHELSRLQGEGECEALSELPELGAEWTERPAIVQPVQSRWRHLVGDEAQQEAAHADGAEGDARRERGAAAGARCAAGGCEALAERPQFCASWNERRAVVQPVRSKWRHLVGDDSQREAAYADGAEDDARCDRVAAVGARGAAERRAKRQGGGDEEQPAEPRRVPESRSKWAKFA